MSSADDRKGGRTGKSASRQQRLAAALRENLRRRKAQARGRSANPERNGHPSRGPEEKRGD